MSAAIKVAGYCRVSTEQEDQRNSLAAQQRYFKELIEGREDWELYQIYADEGITGTSTKKREQFKRMISDAHEGKFQLIVTKEVSRFSRNILDTIAYTRELKALGVGVLFMNDGISTLDPDAELRLSIMASVAQEESRKASSRVKWGQARQMERGVVFGRSLLGYQVKDGKIRVQPEEAELVRLIFRKYGLEKKGTTVIARELREAGYCNPSGTAEWRGSYLLKLLKNEKYVGDLVQKKTITPDYLTHARKYNHGQEELIVIKNHHQPIVERHLWDAVQAEMKRRDRHNRQNTGHSARYTFSGKIRCGICGANFTARRKKRKDGGSTLYWACLTAVKEGRQHTDHMGHQKGCNIGRLISNESATEMFRLTLQSLRFNRQQLSGYLAQIAAEAVRETEQAEEEKMMREIERVTKKKEGVLDAFVSDEIGVEEMNALNRRCDRQLEALNERLAQLRQQAGQSVSGTEAGMREHLEAILTGRVTSELFCKTILDNILICPDKTAELSLQCLSLRWRFSL